MLLDSSKVSLAMATGLSAVCATCEKYWEARDKEVPDNRCMATSGCGSPLAGDDFHEYSGPLKGALHKQCFVCGGPPAVVVQVGRSIKDIGICRDHVVMFEKVEAVQRPQPQSKNFRGVNGASVDALLNPFPEKKGLAASIYEVEKYYADKEGRELDLG